LSRQLWSASPTHSWPLTANSLGVVVSQLTHLGRAPRSAHAWSALGIGCTDIASRRLVLWAAVRDCAGLREELAQCALSRYAVSVIGEEPRLADGEELWLAHNRVLLSSVLAGHERDGDAPPAGATGPPVKICS
jgi:hypothetical protein